MIVAVCSDKGAPGVTTLATVLALVWPGERILLEADPSGGDLRLRMHTPGEQFLALDPTTLSLATAVRSGARGGDALVANAQTTSLGIRVVPGPPVAEAWTPMANLWSAVAARVAAWPGTVITDLGRLQPGHPGLVLAEAADVVLLLTTGTVDGLFHARERARELGAVLERDVARSRVAVVVRAGGKDKAALGEVSRVLKDLVPVVGGFADDPGGVQALLGGSDTAVLRGSALVRSGEDLVARIHRLLPPVEGPSGSVSPARSSASLRLLRRVL